MPYDFANSFSNNFMGMYQFNQQRKLDQERLGMERERVGFDRERVDMDRQRTAAMLEESAMNRLIAEQNHANAIEDRKYLMDTNVNILGNSVPLYYANHYDTTVSHDYNNRALKQGADQFAENLNFQRLQETNKTNYNNNLLAISLQTTEQEREKEARELLQKASASFNTAWERDEFGEAKEISALWNDPLYRGSGPMQLKVETLKDNLKKKTADFARTFGIDADIAFEWAMAMAGRAKKPQSTNEYTQYKSLRDTNLIPRKNRSQ